MDLRPGYKQTEVGSIPEDWQARPLAWACTLLNGRAYALHEWETGGVPVIRLQNLTGGGDYYYSRLKLPDDKYCNSGDLLFMWSATFGPRIWHGERAIYHYHIWKVIPHVERATTKYLYYKLEGITREKKTRAANGGTMLHVTKRDMDSTLIAVPCVEEQKAIGEALNDADVLIESLELLLTKSRRLKQGVLQELLTGKRRLPGFEIRSGLKQCEFGLIPEDWEVASLSSVSKEPMQNGLFFKPSLKGSGVKLINVGDLYARAPIDSDALELFNATTRERERFRVEDGDLFFTRSSIVPAGIAHCNIYRSCNSESVVFDSHVIRLKPDAKKVVPSYLFRYCSGSVARRYLVSHAKTGTMTTIDQSVLGKCPIVLPQLAEQEAIASVLSDIDSEIVALEAKLAKARNLKQGMMQNLLTGEIRLTRAMH